MYEQIFGKVGVFLSRDFLAKGLLPALILLMLSAAPVLGWHAIIAGIAAVLRAPVKQMASLVQWVLVLLLISALFSIFSAVIFSFFEGSALPRPIRESLRKRSSARRIILNVAVDEHESRATLLKWLRTEKLDQFPFVPPLTKQVTEAALSDPIERALQTLKSLQKRNAQFREFRLAVDSWQTQILMLGLGAMRRRICVAKDLQTAHSPQSEMYADSVRHSVTEWAELLRCPENAGIAQELQNAIYYEWVSSADRAGAGVSRSAICAAHETGQRACGAR